MDEVRRLLDREIERELEEMVLSLPDSEGYKEATERLDKLYQRRIDEEKLVLEREKLKNDGLSLVEGRRDRYVKMAVDGASILLPLCFYGIWMRRGLKFEESGSFTSSTFRGLVNRFKPTR